MGAWGMKHISKGIEPPALVAYRNAQPQATWEEMRHDGENKGQQSYDACRAEALQQQGNICAYCECSLSINQPRECRLEHFHPKSDRTTDHNWALDWQNIIGVCIGGSGSKHEHPLPQNLSCDAYKDFMIQNRKLDECCEGWVLNPLNMLASPALFAFDKAKGYLVPHKENCAQVVIEENNFATTEELVLNTIAMLNLNCDRLVQERLCVFYRVERLKKEKRMAKIQPSIAMQQIAEQLLQKRWHQYFTTIRSILGNAAEEYLQKIGYAG
jgi:uncharacterized protein (TIGR02646 family)